MVQFFYPGWLFCSVLEFLARDGEKLNWPCSLNLSLSVRYLSAIFSGTSLLQHLLPGKSIILVSTEQFCFDCIQCFFLQLLLLYIRQRHFDWPYASRKMCYTVPRTSKHLARI